MVVGFSRALKLAIFFSNIMSTVTILNVAYTSATFVAPSNGHSIDYSKVSIPKLKLEEFPARGLERFGISSSILAGAWVYVYVCVFGILVSTCIARIVKAYWASAKGDDFEKRVTGPGSSDEDCPTPPWTPAALPGAQSAREAL